MHLFKQLLLYNSYINIELQEQSPSFAAVTREYQKKLKKVTDKFKENLSIKTSSER